MLTPDIVFIDTSVFIAENYFASGNRIHTLMQLAEEGKINLVLSEITVQEVRKHIIPSTRDAWKQFDKVCKVFRNREEIDKWRKSTNDKRRLIITFPSWTLLSSPPTLRFWITPIALTLPKFSLPTSIARNPSVKE